jgi:AraC-like DNA-binding protein
MNTDFMEIIFILGLVLVAIYFAYHIMNHDHSKDLYIELKNKSPQTIDHDLLQKRFDLLTALMVEKKPFKQSDLTLKRLAEMSDLKPSELSQVIKIKNESNFYEFVKHYRIDSIKDDLINSDEHIIIIAYDNGFNSKSTFNTAFKKKTNYTPSRFRNEFGRTK